MFVKNPNLGAYPNLGEITVLIRKYILVQNLWTIDTKLTNYWYKTYELLIQNVWTIAAKLTNYCCKTYELLLQNLRTFAAKLTNYCCKTYELAIDTKSLAWLNICVWTSALNTRLIKHIFFIFQHCRIFGFGKNHFDTPLVFGVSIKNPKSVFGGRHQKYVFYR